MSATSDETGTTASSSTTSGSTLSAEAAEFVPSSFARGNCDDAAQQEGSRGGGSSSGVNPLAEVPRFLTTCYPFVNLTSPQGVKVRVDNPGAVSGRAFGATSAFAAGNVQHHHPFHHLGVFPHQVGYHPHHPTSSTTLAWVPGLQPAPAFAPALPMAPLTPGVHIPFDGGTPGLGRCAGLLPTPKHDGLLPNPTRTFSPLNGQQVLTPGLMVGACPSPIPGQVMLGDRKNAAGLLLQANAGQGASVSRGTQKETSSPSSGGRARTIILKDNFMQTDFNRDLANYTLLEKPSILYRRGQRKNKGNCPLTSTDSEEVDSDSGYSSPLHRRNLVSNGTHPARMTTTDEDGELGKTAAQSGDKGKKGSLPAAGGNRSSSPREAQQLKGSGRSEGVVTKAAAISKAAKSPVKPLIAAGDKGAPSAPSGGEKAPSAAQRVSGVEGKNSASACPWESTHGLSGKTGSQATAAAKDKESSRVPVNTKAAAKSETISSPMKTTQNCNNLPSSNRTSSVTRQSQGKDRTTSNHPQSKNTPDTKQPQSKDCLTGKQPDSKNTLATTQSKSKDSLIVSQAESKDIPNSQQPQSKDTSITKEIPHKDTHATTKQPHSPGSTRRSATPSPALLDFPVLKPAKRNEPPWSLTPNANKSKKTESCGFMGMVADSVKSYASIVKSLSSPSKAQPDAQTHTEQAEAAGTSSPSSGESSTVRLKTDASSWAGLQLQPSNSNETSSFGDGWVSLKSVNQNSPGGDAYGVGGDGVQLQPEKMAGLNPVSGSLGRGWVRLLPEKGDVSKPGQAQQPSQTGSALAAKTSGSKKGGSIAAANMGSTSASSQGSVRKSRAIWVGEEGTVLRGSKTDKVGRKTGACSDSGNNQSSPAAKLVPQSTGTWGGAGDITRQHCDTGAGHLSAGEGGPSWNRPDNPSPKATQSGAARSLSLDFPRLSRSSERSVDKAGYRTDSTHRQSALSGEEKTDEEGKKTRRRRRRRRKRGKSQSEEGLSDGTSGMERTVSSSNISRSSDITLHFEDEDELLGTGAASGNEGVYSVISSNEGRSPMRDVDPASSLPYVDGGAVRKPDPLALISYSDVLKRKPRPNDVRSRTQSAPGSCLSGEEGGDENFNSQPGQGSSEQNPHSKRARKRRKRRELANRAAEAELAEISLEQQMLRQKVTTGHGSRPGSGSRDEKSPARGLITDQAVVKQAKGGGSQPSSGKRLHQPMSLSIADMLDAFEKKKSMEQKTASVPSSGAKKALLPHDDKKTPVTNLLDSNAPIKRGKERETPKPKKPSPLKKIILKEREEKKRMRMIGDEVDVYPRVDLPSNTDSENEVTNPVEDSLSLKDEDGGNPVGLGESDLSQDGLSSRSLDTDQGVSPGADLSPISQTSPISMSPLTPGASPINSPIAGYLSRDPVVLRIHSRRFREYCTQILDKDIDACCTALLHELVRFQDRMYHKDPNKAKGKRRVVLGLREVTKHLKLKKIKCVIISPNLEKIQSKGGLDEALNNILNMCQEQNVPFVFALGRRALGRACAKLVPVSVAGIFNYEGCEEKFNQLISLTHKGREAYADMVRAVEQEIVENPPPSMTAGSSVPSLYAHMGHSRTPSGCSAISFTSSVLSEPISENYPHAEPETDSKGYEIVRDEDGNIVSNPRAGAYQNGAGLPGYQPSMDDFDDGNEADTEDIIDAPRRRKSNKRGEGEGKGKLSECTDSEEFFDAVDDMEIVPERVDHVETSVNQQGAEEEEEEEEAAEEADSASESDSQLWSSTPRQHLPHIDSIHSNLYDLSTEILSQHSSRTLDNSEVLSTHSSRTLGDGSATPNTEQGRECPHTPDGSGRSRGSRLMSKERVQTWVESCLQEEKDSDSLQDSPSGSDQEGEDNFVTARSGVCDGLGG